MGIAVPFVLVQKNFRRLLAYSTIDQAGIMAVALGMGGKMASLALMLHMTFHSAAKPLLFFCAGNIGLRFKTDLFSHLKGGVIRAIPLTGVALFLGMLAIAGVPPLCFFQSEFLMLGAAFSEGHLPAAILFILFGTGLFAGIAAHVSRVALGGSDEAPAPFFPWRDTAIVVLAAVLLVISFWLPGPLLELINRAVLVVSA
jgi:hydrogenase-4 component F